MKKIPTLFVREFEGHKIKSITDTITPGLEDVLRDGVVTIKIDGACCAFINGEFYRRYDAKQGKTPPLGAIPCCDPDPVTGHWPHWVKVDVLNPADTWFMIAKYQSGEDFKDGTYEAIGPHFQGNPYRLPRDILIPHGIYYVEIERTFEAIREYLRTNEVEGLVFWMDGEPRAKVKRTDFGFEWPIKGVRE